MTIDHVPQFQKHYKKRISRYPKLKKQFSERLSLFVKDPKHPLLYDHSLSGSKKSFRAFSMTGDIRVVYRIEGDIVRLYDVGTHNQVY
ncbi:type II toxin-antitoxin system mRNA interferase toxin, RelE/StbE family [Candidatus Gottesmanbacteria bacterium]|nr:type II toxin-antitoxin system mRNA interferase toxin, RelE/StbE family [Candidatus Gottesmanbacteria bacterium]